jgi:hypothetical protein
MLPPMNRCGLPAFITINDDSMFRSVSDLDTNGTGRLESSHTLLFLDILLNHLVGDVTVGKALTSPIMRLGASCGDAFTNRCTRSGWMESAKTSHFSS